MQLTVTLLTGVFD